MKEYTKKCINKVHTQMFGEHCHRKQIAQAYSAVTSCCPFKQMDGGCFPYFRMMAASIVRRYDFNTEKAYPPPGKVRALTGPGSYVLSRSGER